MKPRILFMGTDSHSGYILNFLLNHNFNVVAVVSQPDKQQGRKKQIVPTIVKQIAINNDIPIYQPDNLSKNYHDLLEIEYDVLLTVAYGQIVPNELLKHTKVINLNVHYSLLPKYRGSSPVQSAILNGDEKTGVSLMEMVEKLDAGDIYVQEEVEINQKYTATELFGTLNDLACQMLLKNLDEIVNNKIKSRKQNEELATYCKKISKNDEHINFNDDVVNVYNHIRSLLDNPGCYFMVNDVRYKIHKAEYELANSTPNKVIKLDKNGLKIGCKNGNIIITKLQPAGKKPIDINNYVNGSKICVNDDVN